jgi:dolichol-phosphate mannosyltransferase
VPWFVLIAHRQEGFASYFLWRHHVLRFVSAFDHEAPIWYYLPVLLIGMFPSSLLLGPTLHFLAGRREELRGLRTRELGALALAAVWIVVFFSASSCKLPTYILPAVPLLCLVQGYVLHQLLAGKYISAVWARLAHRLPVHATELAAAIGAGIAVADLVLEPDFGVAQVVNYVVLGGSLAFLLYRVVHRRSWPARAASWGMVAGVSLLIMGFAFQKFVPEFARYRSVHANAARLCRTADGTSLPVVYFAWQSDGSSLYLPADQVRRFRDGEWASLQRFILEHPHTVIVADPPHAALLRDILGDRVALTRSRGARGRLYLSSTLPTANTLVGARDSLPVQR